MSIKNIKLATKMILMVTATIAVILVIAFSYLTFKEKQKDMVYAYANSEAIARQNAAQIKAELEFTMNSARTLAQTLGAYEDFALKSRRENCNALMRRVTAENPQFIGVWACFAPNTLDGLDTQYANAPGYDETGRFAPYWQNIGGEVVLAPAQDAASYDMEDPNQAFFFHAYHSGEETVLEPYEYEVDGKNMLLTAFSVPVKNVAGEIVGVVGIDISLAYLNEMEFNRGDYTTMQLYLLSYEGTYVIHSDDALVGKALVETEPADNQTEQMLTAIKKGRSYTAEGISAVVGDKIMKTMVPVVLGDSSTPWSVGLDVGMDEVTAASRANTVSLMMIFAIVIVAVGLAIALAVVKMIKKPLDELVDVAVQQAQGNYALEVGTTRHDEIGRLFQSMQTVNNNMNALLLGIKIAAEQVSVGSHQISASSVALSQGATGQAASIEQLTASTEEIASQMQLNAEHAGQAKVLAKEVRANAESGNQQMQELLHAMEEIREAADNIATITKAIDDISFQTNILALNAAVEAARAGQHGKGFAVVAEEVRSLAEQSVAAAKETTVLIETSMEKAVAGGKLAEKTARQLTDIVREINDLSGLIHDISMTSNEQAAGIDQINDGLMRVSHVVQSNTANAQEGAAASEELNEQAEALKSQVSRFKLRADNRDFSQDLPGDSSM